MAATNFPATNDNDPYASVPYALRPSVPEWQRQDIMHKAINKFIGNTISFAPVTKPKTILELGAGSGAWAIQASIQFPYASVTAVDMAPLPPLPMPRNLKYQQANLLEPLPFPRESFDVIHIRFVLLHLPKYKSVLKRVIELLKPGGWLLIEDFYADLRDPACGPARRKFLEVFVSYVASRGIDPYYVAGLDGVLKQMHIFSEVNVKVETVSISDRRNTQSGGQLSIPIGTRVVDSLGERIKAFGMTPDIIQAYVDEMNDPNRNAVMDLYFTWAKKQG